MDSSFINLANTHVTVLSFIFQIHRYTGRGLFLNPPSVSMYNNKWNISIPEEFQQENQKLESISKFKMFNFNSLVGYCLEYHHFIC